MDKFKIGDKVKFRQGFGGVFDDGKPHEVVAVYGDRYKISGLRGSGSGEMWEERALEAANSCFGTNSVVANALGGKAVSNAVSFTYYDADVKSRIEKIMKFLFSEKNEDATYAKQLLLGLRDAKGGKNDKEIAGDYNRIMNAHGNFSALVDSLVSDLRAFRV